MMNDRYLFRGKSEIGERWIVGNLLQWSDGCTQIARNDNDGDKYKYIVIPETVGQCTGLKDKNGKLIFEGDILLFTNEDGEKTPYKVKWSKRFAQYIISMGNGLFDTMNYWIKWRKCHEIIGNAYDNPELLEVQE